MKFKQYLKEDILTQSLEDFISNPPKGYEYSTDLYIAQRDRQKKVTRLTSRFFTKDPDNRKWILFHELGHDLIQSPTDFNKYFKEVMEPLRVDKQKPISAQSKYNDYFHSGIKHNYPEEVIANGYLALLMKWYKGYDKDGEVYQFIKAIEKRAKQLRMPTDQRQI